MSNLELKGLKLLRTIDNPVSHDDDARRVEPYTLMAVENLMPGVYQPRTQITEPLLIELSNSIKLHGVIQPLIVRRMADDKYEIIAGERRWRAAQMAGLPVVPVIIKQVDDQVALAFSLIENIQRENLNPIEEAVAFSRFCNEFKMTHEEIGSMVGRSRASITNSLRLLLLEPRVMKLLETGVINMGHARALLTLTRNDQYEVACRIAEKQLSVRETEAFVKTFSWDFGRNTSKPQAEYHPQCENWTKILSTKWATEVSVKLSVHGHGQIVIHVNSLDELQRLIE
jgi:ParB family chromosome partitioning protein